MTSCSTTVGAELCTFHVDVVVVCLPNHPPNQVGMIITPDDQLLLELHHVLLPLLLVVIPVNRAITLDLLLLSESSEELVDISAVFMIPVCPRVNPVVATCPVRNISPVTPAPTAPRLNIYHS